MSWQQKTLCDGPGTVEVGQGVTVCGVEIPKAPTAWHQVAFKGGQLGLDLCADCRKRLTVHEVIELILARAEMQMRSSKGGSVEVVTSFRRLPPRSPRKRRGRA